MTSTWFRIIPKTTGPCPMSTPLLKPINLEELDQDYLANQAAQVNARIVNKGSLRNLKDAVLQASSRGMLPVTPYRWPCLQCNFMLEKGGDSETSGLCAFDYGWRNGVRNWSKQDHDQKEKCSKWLPRIHDISTETRMQERNRILDLEDAARARQDDRQHNVKLMFIGGIFGAAMSTIVGLIIYYITAAT